MREILFRGKGDTQYNDGDWYYGVPIQDDRNWQICTSFSKRVVLPNTIGEFIGRHDKNDKMIFEWDIVRAKLKGESEKLYIVKYHISALSFMLMDDTEQYYRVSAASSIEVLGNIWDNPELLGGVS